MKIAVTDQGKFADFSIRTGPWASFFDTLESEGHSIVSLNEKPNAVVYMNNNRGFKSLPPNTLRKNRRILILWEPRATKPRNFSKRRLASFGLVFSPSRHWIQGENVRYFNWPQPDSIRQVSNWGERNDKFIAIFGNKFSQDKDALYHLRRELVRKLDDVLDLYGTGWDSKPKTSLRILNSILLSKGRLQSWTVRDALCGLKRPRNYRGELSDKDAAFSQYKYSLVIENCSTYVSEKLFESAVKGLIPVYVGPRLAEFGIPEDFSINPEHNSESIENACRELLELNENEKLRLLNNAERFLRSNEYRMFCNKHVLRTIGLEISAHLKEDSYAG